MKFSKLVVLFPKEKDLGEGDLNIDRHGEATFMCRGKFGDELAALLKRARIEFVSATGMRLSGMEPDGYTKSGQEKFRYQEWWLVANEVAKVA